MLDFLPQPKSLSARSLLGNSTAFVESEEGSKPQAATKLQNFAITASADDQLSWSCRDVAALRIKLPMRFRPDPTPEFLVREGRIDADYVSTLHCGIRNEFALFLAYSMTGGVSSSQSKIPRNHPQESKPSASKYNSQSTARQDPIADSQEAPFEVSHGRGGGRRGARGVAS